MKKTKLIKLSICSCGFPALAAHIPLGTEYDVVFEQTLPFSFTCGGCKKTWSVDCIMIHREESGQPPGYLSAELFDLTPNEKAFAV